MIKPQSPNLEEDGEEEEEECGESEKITMALGPLHPLFFCSPIIEDLLCVTCCDSPKFHYWKDMYTEGKCAGTDSNNIPLET